MSVNDSEPVEQKLELLPNTFQCVDREWVVEFTDELMTSVKKVTGFDLWKSIEVDNSPLAALGDDERKLRDAAWACVSDAADQLGVKREDFVRGCRGDVLDAVYDAIQGGLQRFFSARRRAAMRRATDFLAAKGRADIEHREKTHAESLRISKEVGAEKIAEMGSIIRDLVNTKTSQQISEFLKQHSASAATSSNAAETAGSILQD